MATLVSKANGDFTDSASWANVDSTSLQISETSNTSIPTSPASSPTFTPGAVTVDGIALKIATRGVSASGTFTAELTQGGTPVTGTTVTVNVVDIPVCSTSQNNGGWIFFKFASPVLLAAATAYAVRVSASIGGQISLYRSSTSNDWARILRLTDTATPAAGDIMYIVGEHTGAGARTDLTIVMDNTATTDFGSIHVSQGGILSFETSSATDYYLKMSGVSNIFANGILNVGTSGSPIPGDSTAVIEFDPASDGQYGLNIKSGAVLNMYGTSKTVAAYLDADASVAATSITSDISTGWKSGDVIGIASTTRTPGDCETVTLSGDASGTTISVGALANAHSGSTGTEAELINLTRNIMFRSATSTFGTYLNFQGDAAVHIEYVAFQYLGDASLNRGIEVSSTFIGPAVIHGCAFRDFEYSAIYSTASAASITISSNVFYNMITSNSSTAVIYIASSSGSVYINDNVIMLCSASAASGILRVGNGALEINGNTIVGINNTSATGLALDGNTYYPEVVGNTIHSCAMSNGNAMSITSSAWADIADLKIWRISGNGLRLNISDLGKTVIAGLTALGISGNSIEVNGDSYTEIIDGILDGEASYSATAGIYLAIGASTIILKNCSFGAVTGFTTADIRNYLSTSAMHNLVAYNCIFGSSTKVSSMSAVDFRSQIHLHKYNQLDSHKNFYKYGNAESEETIRNTASGFSWKLTPLFTDRKLVFPGPTQNHVFQAQVQANETYDVGVYILKDSSYNGNAPRLMLLGGIVAGVDDEVSSLTVGADTWELVSVNITPTESGVIQFYVDCDGTAGSVYVDDVTVT